MSTASVFVNRPGQPFQPRPKHAHTRAMMRLHLSGDDLARTLVRDHPAPLWEVVGSVREFRSPEPSPRLRVWRLATRSALKPSMAPLFDILPYASYMPDFLTPLATSGEFEAELETVLTTPTARIRADLEPLVGAGTLPPRARPLFDGDAAAVRRLGEAIRAYHAAAIAPYWDRIVARLTADRNARGRLQLTLGIGRLLGTLSPYLKWTTDILSYDCGADIELDVVPGGVGVELLPVYFQTQPAVLHNPPDPAVLCYPVEHEEDLTPLGEPLAALLGRTRAAILGAIGDGCTTTQLARRVGVSVPSASQHARVLRSAGLVSTSRLGSAVLHTLTPLGTSLLGTATRSRSGAPDRDR
jgi:DNA-binding transcriptional ArsR family regulator